MNEPHHTATSHTDRSLPLALTQVCVHALHPMRFLIAAFQGTDAERETDALLHTMSLYQPREGIGSIVEVKALLDDGSELTNLHLVRFADTDGSVRSHMRSTLMFLLRHEHCPSDGRSFEEHRRLYRDLAPDCRARYDAIRLLQCLREPPPAPDDDPLAMEGCVEYNAALAHALRDGVCPEDAMRRASSIAMTLAPPAVGRWAFAVGVWSAQEMAASIRAGRPPRPRRPHDGA